MYYKYTTNFSIIEEKKKMELCNIKYWSLVQIFHHNLFN